MLLDAVANLTQPWMAPSEARLAALHALGDARTGLRCVESALSGELGSDASSSSAGRMAGLRKLYRHVRAVLATLPPEPTGGMGQS